MAYIENRNVVGWFQTQKREVNIMNKAVIIANAISLPLQVLWLFNSISTHNTGHMIQASIFAVGNTAILIIYLSKLTNKRKG